MLPLDGGSSPVTMSGDPGKDKLDAIPDVQIDAGGKFKYVLIQLTIGDHKKHIVRGNKAADWHSKSGYSER